jgi:hypothetical protein
MLERAGFEVLRPARVRGTTSEEDVPQQLSNIFTFNVLRSWNGAATPAALARISIPEFLKPPDGGDKVAEERKPRVAVFDQFEELFTSYQERPEDREDFLDQIGAALEQDRLLRVVFAMREEFIAELDPYLSLLPEKLRTRYRLERLNEDDALLAVTEPLGNTEYSFAPGVAEQLIENLLMVPVETAAGATKVRGDSVEPVQLQVVCQTLWENCQKSWRALQPSDKKTITHEYLEAFGNVDQALTTFYESAIDRTVETNGVKEGPLRKWFEQSLITSAGTRGTVFRGRNETGGIPNAAVDLLVNQHIIKGEVRGGSRWYELTHDRLIAPIKASNESWFLAHSGGEQTPKRLEARAEQWVRDGRKKADLLDEGELLEARRWLETPGAADVGYSDALFSLVQASRVASEEAARERERVLAAEQQRAAQADRELAREQRWRIEEQVRSARRLRSLIVALGLMLIVASGASIWAWRKEKAAEAAQVIADYESQRAKQESQKAQSRADDLARANEEGEELRKRAESESLRATRESDNALRQAHIASLNEAKAVSAMVKAREITKVRDQLRNDEGEALVLLRGDNEDLNKALVRYQQIRGNYELIGDTAGQKRAQSNLDFVQRQIKARQQ